MNLTLRILIAILISAFIIYIMIATGLNIYGSIIAGVIAGLIILYLTSQYSRSQKFEELRKDVPKEESFEQDNLKEE